VVVARELGKGEEDAAGDAQLLLGNPENGSRSARRWPGRPTLKAAAFALHNRPY